VDAGPSCTSHASSLYTSPVTFTGTISGNMPSMPDGGPPFALYVALRAGVHLEEIPLGASTPSCDTPTNVEQLLDYRLFDLPLTLPLTYCFTVNFSASCGEGVELVVAPTDSFLTPFGDATAQCGCLEGICEGPPFTYGWGGPPITCSPVVCNIVFP
jgi:hypothetical protein